MRIEKLVEDECMKLAKKHGWLGRLICYRGKRDSVDCFFAKPGRVVFIEMKSPGEKARESQLEEHDLLRASGLEVYLVDTIGKFKLALDIVE